MTVLFFGVLAEVVGNSKIEMDPSPDTDSLRNALFQQYPALAHHAVVLAVNLARVQNNTALSPTDEVAMLPPFAGG